MREWVVVETAQEVQSVAAFLRKTREQREDGKAGVFTQTYFK